MSADAEQGANVFDRHTRPRVEPLCLGDQRGWNVFRGHVLGWIRGSSLEARAVTDAGGFRASFEVEEYRREMLLRGLDEIGRTLLDEPRIAAFERSR